MLTASLQPLFAASVKRQTGQYILMRFHIPAICGFPLARPFRLIVVVEAVPRG
jgi:hypothetical protein